MCRNKIVKALLFPHIAVALALLPVATASLVYSMLYLEESSLFRIASYVLAFYTLTIWSVRTPKMLRLVRAFKNENKYMKLWLGDPRLRTNVSLCAGILWNSAYAALLLGMGSYHRSSWFLSLAAYYVVLALMRFHLVSHTMRHRPGEKMVQELRHYRACGWIFLLINLALSCIMFHMIRQNRMMHHHEITTIAMAAYTFTTLTLAIVNVVRYRKYNSPAISAAKAISLAAACVSMLTLENTMLATFSGADMTPRIRQLFLSLSGGAVSVFIIMMALYMIAAPGRKIKTSGDQYNGKQ